MVQIKLRYFIFSFIFVCYIWQEVVCSDNVNVKDANKADDQGGHGTSEGQRNTVEEQGTDINLAHEQLKRDTVKINTAQINHNEMNQKYKSQHDQSLSMHASQQNIKPPTNTHSLDENTERTSNEDLLNYESSQDHLNFKNSQEDKSHEVPSLDTDNVKVEEQSNTETLFEENGSADENLVEQMKRLSEKIKKAVAEEKKEMIKSADTGIELKLNDLNKIKNKKQRDRIEKALKANDIKDNEGFDNMGMLTEKMNKIDNYQNVPGSGSVVDSPSKKGIIEQFKDIEKKIESIPTYYSHEEEDDIFPSENSFIQDDSSGDISSIEIVNTKPPSNIQPSKTQTDEIKLQSSSDNLESDKTFTREMSTVYSLKPSSVVDLHQTQLPIDKHNKHKSNTESENSNLAKKNKRIRKYRESKVDKLFKVSEQLIESSDQKYTRSHDVQRSSIDMLNIQATATLETLSTQKIVVRHTVASNTENVQYQPKGAYYSGTSEENNFKHITIQQSSVQSGGEMKKTEVKHQAHKHLTRDVNGEAGKSENQQHFPRSTENLAGEKDVEEPPPMGGSTQRDAELDSSGDIQNQEAPVTEEESEADKQNREQAEKYFEEGEKLVNNSYKKDYIQAYEYFKLAADLGHIKSLEYLGFGHLLGDYIPLDPEKALKIFKDLSAKGLPRGQLGLGLCYSAGLAVNSSQAKALIYFTFSALGGDSLAQMVLGYRYLSGIGVESKCETALQYYRKVATTVAENTSSGGPIIQRVRLNEQADNKDTGAALMDSDLLQYYEFLADKGDVQAQVVLGQLYYQAGRGVPLNHEVSTCKFYSFPKASAADTSKVIPMMGNGLKKKDKRAHHYFSMAAESGNSNSLAFLGKMHSEGSPVIAQDHSLAHRYFKKAEEKGNPIGQCGLGIQYLYGRGVEKDYAKALNYFSRSADQGWSDGQLHLGIMHFSGKGVRRDYKMAVKYFNLASQGGHVLAFYHLAQMHATGTGVLRNCHTAVELYKNVAERGTWASKLMEAHQLYKDGNINEALLKYTFLAELGYEVAQTNVAYILDQGESSLFDQKETYQRALLHWTRAASQGSTMARLKMGDYHYYGYGTEIDYETAATHYRLATEQQHNAQAMFNLGYMHENGLGLKQDVHLAKRFYDMAAETSVDAYVPVSLALVKLGLFYGVEVFNKELESFYNIVNRLDPRYQLGPNWDIYLSTFLAIVLGIVIILRRQR